MAKRYRKTTTITAEQFWPDVKPWPKGVELREVRDDDNLNPQTWTEYGVRTLGGWHIVRPGDWIATGVNGKRRPIKPDVFEATYVEVEADEEAPIGDTPK